MLAESVRQQSFFTLSNQAESGVVAVEQLQQIWPNMQLKEQRKLQTQCLQDLLSSPSLQALQEASCIWGVIDCLPALPILKGAGDELKKWSVLWVRVVLHDVFLDSKQQDLSSLVDISSFLRELGYRCIEVVKENDPALGYALFIQDWHKRYDASLLESTQLKDYKARVVKLEQQCQQQEVETKQLENYKKQVEEFKQQLQERDYRQKLLDEEFIKVEAQVELIKDVLLKEKSL